ELRGSDAAADNGSPNGELAGLLLGNDAQMIAVNLGRRLEGFGGIKRVPDPRFEGGEEGVGGPAVFEKKVFEAGFVAGLAEEVALAEEFGNGADYGDGLIPTDESVEGNGEMGLRGEATGHADGEADLVGTVVREGRV